MWFYFEIISVNLHEKSFQQVIIFRNCTFARIKNDDILVCCTDLLNHDSSRSQDLHIPGFLVAIYSTGQAFKP